MGRARTFPTRPTFPPTKRLKLGLVVIMAESCPRAAIYARVSTADQNCDLQLRELREYAARRGWELAGEYVDTGFSGAKASRPALDRLIRSSMPRRGLSG